MATPQSNTVSSTYNTDIDGLVRRINRFIVEVIKSQSSGVSNTLSYDVIRMQRYIDAVRQYADWVTSQPTLDLPETGPRAVQLQESPVIPDMENESLYDIAVLFELARDELANSQSSRMSSNLIDFDHDRLIAILDKADLFITNFLQVVDPVDLPESSPMSEITGPGLKGV